MGSVRWGVCSAVILALGLASGWTASAQVANKAPSSVDQQIQSQVQQQLQKNKNLSGVQPFVDDQVVTLSGTVENYRSKLQAAHDAQQVNNVNGVINRIAVGGPTVPDAQLQQQLSQRLTYDRMGMGQTFNGLTVQVHNGIVTVGGQVIDYPSRDSALDIVDDTKGVKGVVDNIQVAPLSPMDDQIRLEAARKIYGNPTLSMYANDPAHTIRILVDNGHVTLAGVVNSQVDKQTAQAAVQSIPGVFSVKNDLVVAH